MRMMETAVVLMVLVVSQSAISRQCLSFIPTSSILPVGPKFALPPRFHGMTVRFQHREHFSQLRRKEMVKGS
jgi:hypothetical protein